MQQFASPIELYDRPVNKFVARFIGSPKMNFFEATSTETGNVQIVHGPELAIAGLNRASLAGRLTVGLRMVTCGPWANAISTAAKPST